MILALSLPTKDDNQRLACSSFAPAQAKWPKYLRPSRCCVALWRNFLGQIWPAQVCRVLVASLAALLVCVLCEGFMEAVMGPLWKILVY